MRKKTEVMKPRSAIKLIVGLIVLIGIYGAACAQGQPPVPAEEQPQVLTRGPVHEAFAEPVPLQIEAGLIVPDQPPANIEEVPPADRPQGDQFVWVPGYWSWDADRNGFIWVSACWRAAPPDRSWVPGYWAAVTGGWEWVSGFWTPTDAQEIEYLSAPPASMDIEPPGPPPSADNMWVPGCWYWQDSRYVRRPGYWLRQQRDWVWEPSHYRWTPRGYVFEAGHWDYSLERRGVLFAPVYFPRSAYARAGFSYSPRIAIDLSVLLANLFTYPRYGHYYFGDYYDDVYVRAGIYPRFDSDRLHTWYDPIYTYDRWHYGRADNRWEERQRQEYDRRRANTALRPARTYRQMEARVAQMPEAQRRNVELARPLQTIVERKTSPLKFEQMNTDARQKITRQATDVHKFREERLKWEATGSTNPKAVRPPAKHKAPVTPPVEHKEPVTPPVEHKGPGTPPAEHKEPVTPPVERKGAVTPPTERTPEVVPTREVPATQPDRVKIPKPPTVGKPADSRTPEFTPPPKPEKERQSDADSKGKGKGLDKDKEKGNELDKVKDKDRDRDRDKDKDKDKDEDKDKDKDKDTDRK